MCGHRTTKKYNNIDNNNNYHNIIILYYCHYEYDYHSCSDHYLYPDYFHINLKKSWQIPEL